MSIIRRPRIVFIVADSEQSAMGIRAIAFSQELRRNYECTILTRCKSKWKSLIDFTFCLTRIKPDLLYVLDISILGISSTLLSKLLHRIPVIVDTGDDIIALGKALGRGYFGMLATQALESLAVRIARLIIVRGRNHVALLKKRGIQAVHIPDGVHVAQFSVCTDSSSTIKSTLTIGVVGSTVYIPSRNSCYGWDLIEVIHLLRGGYRGVVFQGRIIGDGNGLEWLKRRAEELNVRANIDFPGRLPYEDLPLAFCDIDICLSTQSNDAIGQVRTTGKLPLYLASGRFILASRVGDAQHVLPGDMLVDYEGDTDVGYPHKLAQRICDLIDRGHTFTRVDANIDIARTHYDYSTLAMHLESVINGILCP